MSNTTTDILPIVMPTINHAVKKSFDTLYKLHSLRYGQWNDETDKHPWLTSLEALANMLAGLIVVPHGVLQIKTSSGKLYTITKPSRSHRLMVGDYYPKGSYVNRITKVESICNLDVCKECYEASMRKEAYNKVLLEEKQ